MNIAMFVIFLITDLSMVGICAAVYGGKYKYSEGMILGVHVPRYAGKEPEVQQLIENYRKKNKSFYLWNLLLGAGISFLTFWKFSVFMTIWTIWLLVFMAGATALICLAHRKMYDLKLRKNWIVGEPVQNILVDTKVTAENKKLPFSHWWHLPVFLATVAIFIFVPQIRESFGDGWEGWILPGTLLLLVLTYWGMHLWFGKRRNIVYSSDSDVNLAVNRADKRAWSSVWIGANYVNFISFGFFLYPLAEGSGMNAVGLFVFIALQMLIVAGIAGAAFWLRNKRRELLDGDAASMLVDDDVYWKNGWYNNPEDQHLFVQDRLNTMNMSMNLGRPAGKIMVGIVVGATLALLIWMCTLFIKMDFVEIQMQIGADQIEIESGMYDLSVPRKDIESVEIVENLPEEKLTRTNGAAVEEYLLGKFRGKETGACRLYIYRGYTPILKIVVPEYTIYINSKTENQVEQWYQTLK